MRARHALRQLAALAATIGFAACRDPRAVLKRAPPALIAGTQASAGPVSSALAPAEATAISETERPLRAPTGDAPRLSCSEARAIVAEVRRRLPAEPGLVSPSAFADLWADWFDPHGLWSAAPDAPLADAAHARAAALLSELESSNPSAPCPAALGLAADSKRWVDGLRSVFEQARAEAPAVSFRRALSGVTEPAFEDELVARPARQLAGDLGRRLGQFLKAAPELADAPASAALARFFPDLSAEEWSEVVLSAAVRAYVPAIDPHGEWAPLEEEWALFEGDPIDATEPTLWGNMVRTPLGARIVDAARAPLEVDDLVLSVDGIQTAGLSVEQVEQLARVEPPRGQATRAVRVLRGTPATALELSIAFPQDPIDSADPLA
ncbi:MAG TPA: hypothetical protein VGL19_11435, partial [Polyangiaceae bacterium]